MTTLEIGGGTGAVHPVPVRSPFEQHGIVMRNDDNPEETYVYTYRSQTEWDARKRARIALARDNKKTNVEHWKMDTEASW